MSGIQIVTTATLAIAFLAAVPASAQIEVGTEVALNSQYVWRGLNITSPFVIQPRLWASRGTSQGTFTAGVWGNVEVSDPGSDDLTLRGEAGLGQVDYFGEYTQGFGSLDVTIGVNFQTFQGFPGASNANSPELYGSIGASLPLSPSLVVYHDVGEVKGAYIEASVGHSVAIFDFGAAAGFSAGQEANATAPEELAYFAESGLTHFDLSASTSFTAGTLSIAPEIRYQISQDANTKRTAQTRSARTHIWFGATVSWSELIDGPAAILETP